SVCFLSFFIYFSWSFSHYFNEDFFINAFFELYKLLSFFNIYAYYMTYLMFMIYAFILVTLFTSWFVLFRRLIHRLANRPYVLDLDYKTIKKIVYGKKEVPLFWKFPRSWVKSFYIRLKKPRKSRTLELPEDAEFYYGGPNPSRVLFNHYTGEVFPI